MSTTGKRLIVAAKQAAAMAPAFIGVDFSRPGAQSQDVLEIPNAAQPVALGTKLYIDGVEFIVDRCTKIGERYRVTCVRPNAFLAREIPPFTRKQRRRADALERKKTRQP